MNRTNEFEGCDIEARCDIASCDIRSRHGASFCDIGSLCDRRHTLTRIIDKSSEVFVRADSELAFFSANPVTRITAHYATSLQDDVDD